jgi:hypothetical protein
MCDFNNKLISIDITKLDEKKKIVYMKYFKNHINIIFEDFNDLEKKEDYSLNYVNDEILKIIYLNIVNVISFEIYNSIFLYLFEKYDTESLRDYENDRLIIMKNLKLLLKNKIFDKLEIKNEDKTYETNEFYQDTIIKYFVNLVNKNLDDEEDKKMIEKIIKLYSNIMECIASKFYNEIKEYLINQRKIILMQQIYDKLVYYEEKIN